MLNKILDESPVIRVFLGIPISEAELQPFCKLLLKEYPCFKKQVRWTRPGNHHLTIRFLGNMAKLNVPNFIKMINKVVQEVKPFQITLENISPFLANHGQMVIIKVKTSNLLKILYKKINLILNSMNFPPENRPYIPHITLFRCNNKKSILFNPIPISNKKINVNKLILYRSISTEKGNLYTPLDEFFL